MEYIILFPPLMETAVQAVVGSIVWAFRRLRKPRSREIAPAATRFIAYASNFPMANS